KLVFGLVRRGDVRSVLPLRIRTVKAVVGAGPRAVVVRYWDAAVPTVVRLCLSRTAFSCRRFHEPVTFGVPLPKGGHRDPGAWAVGSEAAWAPVATTVLDRWSDGSVRWM